MHKVLILTAAILSAGCADHTKPHRNEIPADLSAMGWKVVSKGVDGINWTTYFVTRDDILYELEAYKAAGSMTVICCVRAIQQVPSTINLNTNAR